MQKVLLYSLLLIAGLVGSQLLPHASETGAWPLALLLLTNISLSFIMIHVGYEFELNKTRPKQYAWDYAVAAISASLPWALCALYFVFVMFPANQWHQADTWRVAFLEGLFAAPTSAGVLFSMLAAAALASSWLFNKARILAIFDDLHTILLLIPLKIMLIGLQPELAMVAGAMLVLLWIAWTFLHRLRLPITWPFVLGYAAALSVGLDRLHHFTHVHLEVLLPAFVLGCVMARPAGSDPHTDDARIGHEEGPESPTEQRAATIVSACFMVLVGLSMPPIFTAAHAGEPRQWTIIALHVLAVTGLSNLGKMFIVLCYRAEATLLQRLALAVGMFPRGEVGAGVLVVSLSYGFGGDTLTVAVLSLALNLLCTGVFIVIAKKLLAVSEVVCSRDAGV